MSKRLKLMLLLLTVSVVGCSPSSDDKKTSALVPDPTKTARGCFSEDDLLSPSSGIVGGSRIYDGEADSKKVVMVLSTVGELTQICTGSLIARDVILTAAHCIKAASDKTYVVTHSSISCESGFDARMHVQRVSAVEANANYDKAVDVDKSQNDVALIFLSESIWDYPVYRIAKSSEVTDANNIYFYGYGVIGYKKGGSGILRKTEIPRTDYFFEEEKGKVRVDQTKGTGICSGDSGGPGLVSVNGEMKILGINSYVMGEPDTDICKGYSYLALADKYLDWIEKTMWVHGRYLQK